MRVLIMGMNYFPEKTAIGPLTYQLSEYLVQQGHDVTVVTAFPHYPEWKIHDSYKGKFFMKEKIKKIQVYRVPVYIPKSNRAIPRIAYDLSFSAGALAAGLCKKNLDVIISVSPPLQIGLSAWMLSRIKRVPFLFHMQDLVPDAAVDLGMLTNKTVIGIAHRIEAFVYKKASAISYIAHGFGENLLRKGVPESKLHYLPNWIDTDFVKPVKDNNEFRRRNRIGSSDFLVMYAGNIGNKQSLDVLLDAASQLKNDNEIKIYIIGEGANKTFLQQKARELKLDNLTFLGFQPRGDLPVMLSAADLLIITQRASVTDMCMPSKCLYYMSSGTPILASVNHDSEIAKVLNEAKCGVLVEPEDPGKIVEAIIRLKHASNQCREFGHNGRRFVESNFEKSALLKKMEDVLRNLSGS